MLREAVLSAVAACAMMFSCAALAAEKASDPGSAVTLEQAASLLHYSGGNDRMRVEVAPNYSEELGFSLKGAVGSYLTDALALGLIVEYGENKREYLANAGIQFDESLSFIGTVGLLEEDGEFVEEAGRENVQQMEYGASFKGTYQLGVLKGFELNGYLADAETDSDSVETGRLTGVQILTDLDLTDTTHVKLGGGYEWLEWDNTNDDDNHWTFSAEALQRLGDTMSLKGLAKLGASEFVYGGGLAFDLGNGDMNTNSLSVNYSYIDGTNGIQDDQRVELSWTIGFGAGPSAGADIAGLTDETGTIHAAADVATAAPANNLLGEVMKRPAFLPERVIARNSGGGGLTCDSTSISDILIYNNGGDGYDSLQFFESYFTGASTAVLALFPNDATSASNTPDIEVYVTRSGSSAEVKYAKPFKVYGQAGFDYALTFTGALNEDVEDPLVFSTGDTLRVVFKTGSACYEITRTVPAPEP